MAKSWSNEFPGGIAVCDRDGLILEMNEKACKTFEKPGGVKLTGVSLLDCHPEYARAKLLEIMETEKTNAYTIEKKGVKKLI